LAGVNPQDKDYGEVVAGWRKEVFENTINRAYWWGLIVLGLVLGFSLATNGWLMRERERRLAISADVVTQLFNAYVGSRAKALEVIAKYNSLVDRYNRLDVEKKQLADQMAGLPAKSSDSELDYNQAREDRVTPTAHPSAAAQVTNQIALNFDGETPEVEILRSQVAEFETKLQRKTAQLQAKDNQISNLRERLSRAHDSLEGQRKPKTQAS
jgi:chromosome segregation ATPase